MKIKKLYLASLFAISIGVFVPVFLFAPKISAATFVVDSVNDDSDASWGDSLCDNGLGECTLRAAMEEANVVNDDDTINFNIPGAGAQTIIPNSQLPDIRYPVTIDGSSQPSASCGDLVPVDRSLGNTPHELLIKISGQNLFSGPLLDVDPELTNVSPVQLRGLMLVNTTTGFTPYAVRLSDDGAPGSVPLIIDCSYIGVNETGQVAATNGWGVYATSEDSLTVTNSLISANTGLGIYTESVGEINLDGNLIGTDESGSIAMANWNGVSIISNTGDAIIRDNVISSNSDAITTNNSDSLQLYGNYIGIGLDGGVLGNGGFGFLATGGTNIKIGSSNVQDRNIISGNQGDGIRIFAQCNATTVNNVEIINNYIGVDRSGLVGSGYGNTGNGIAIFEYNGFCGSIDDVQIGGVSTNSGNVIAGNDSNGVSISQTANTDVQNVTVVGNSIFENGALALDLALDDDDDGLPDSDIGPNPINNGIVSLPNSVPNSYLNYPVLEKVTHVGSQVYVKYDYNANQPDNSVNLKGYRLDFYASDTVDPSGYGEGKTYLGGFVVDESENDAVHTFISQVPINDGQHISATATLVIDGSADVAANKNNSVLAHVARYIFPKASAEQITLDPDTYHLGSTSEYSQTTVLEFGVMGLTDSSVGQQKSPLANTGQSIFTYIAASLFVMSLALSIIYRIRHNKLIWYHVKKPIR